MLPGVKPQHECTTNCGRGNLQYPRTPSFWAGADVLGIPSARYTFILGWGLLQEWQMCCFAQPGAHCWVWSLGWGCPHGCRTGLGSPAANEGRALLPVPALLAVTTQKLFKWN